MALVKCKECKKEVSDSAKTCPHCGIKNPGVKWNIWHSLFGLAGLIFIYLVVGLFFFGDDDKQVSTDKTESVSKIKKDPQSNLIPSTIGNTNDPVFETTTLPIDDLGKCFLPLVKYKVDSKKPLKLLLSTHAFDEDTWDTQDDEMKRLIVYAAYGALINSKENKVTITSYITDQNNGKKLNKAPEYTVTVTRKRAFDVAHDYFHITKLSELRKDQCHFIKDFNELTYDDSENSINAENGQKGELHTFFTELTTPSA
jgi:hypothetical protein